MGGKKTGRKEKGQTVQEAGKSKMERGKGNKGTGKK